MEAALKHILPKWFKDKPESEVTYQILFKSRLNNSFKKEDAYQIIGGAIREINSLAKVIFKDPVVSVIVEVMKSHVCLAAVRDYHKYKKFNLLQIVGVTDENQRAEDANGDLKRKPEKESEDIGEKAKKSKDSEELKSGELEEKPADKPSGDGDKNNANSVDIDGPAVVETSPDPSTGEEKDT